MLTEPCLSLCPERADLRFGWRFRICRPIEPGLTSKANLLFGWHPGQDSKSDPACALRLMRGRDRRSLDMALAEGVGVETPGGKDGAPAEEAAPPDGEAAPPTPPDGAPPEGADPDGAGYKGEGAEQ